jgi:hypothetical protein
MRRCDLCSSFPERGPLVISKSLSTALQTCFVSAEDLTHGVPDTLIGKDGRMLLPPLTQAYQKRWMMIIALIFLALISIFIWQRSHFWKHNKPEQVQKTAIIVSERYLSCLIEAQRAPRGNFRSKPFTTFDNVILGAGDQVRFHIISPQSGSLYIINEGPKLTAGLPNFNVLFPDTETNGGSPEIRAGQKVQIPLPSNNPAQDWFILDQEEGIEKIWLIWSERAVPELEAVKGWANPKDSGVVRDTKHRESVAHYLAPFPTTKLEIERDEVSKETRLKGKGELLVWLMKLEHR